MFEEENMHCALLYVPQGGSSRAMHEQTANLLVPIDNHKNAIKKSAQWNRMDADSVGVPLNNFVRISQFKQLISWLLVGTKKVHSTN